MLAPTSERLAIEQDIYLTVFKKGEIVEASISLSPRDSSRVYLNEYERAINAFHGKNVVSFNKKLWVKLLPALSPNNLLIRQLCITDLVEETPKRGEDILKHCLTLTYGGKGLWAEGYTYFKYTMEALGIWLRKFKGVSSHAYTIQSLAGLVENRFVVTAHPVKMDVFSEFVPPPVGDLGMATVKGQVSLMREFSLSLAGLSMIRMRSTGAFVTQYSVDALPIRFNTHTTAVRREYIMSTNTPSSYKFYIGYANKYKSKWSELKDLLHWRRFASFFRKDPQPLFRG